MLPRLVVWAVFLLTPLASIVAQGADPPGGAADPLGELRRNAALIFPSRLLNVYFPELALGYRRRLGSDGLWALGATAGPTFSEDPTRGDGLGRIWGFGLGLEGRRYWFDSPAPRVDPYFALGAELSRAYYESRRVLEDVPGENYRQVVEGRTASARHEVLAGLGVDLTWRAGFVIDFRLSLARMWLRHYVPGGTLAPLQIDPFRREPPHYSSQPVDGRGGGIQPRLRVGLGWRW